MARSLQMVLGMGGEGEAQAVEEVIRRLNTPNQGLRDAKHAKRLSRFPVTVTRMETAEMEASVLAVVVGILEMWDIRVWVEHGCRITIRTPKSLAAMVGIVIQASTEICRRYSMNRSTWVLVEVEVEEVEEVEGAIFQGCLATTGAGEAGEAEREEMEEEK